MWLGVSCSLKTNQPWGAGGGVVFAISLTGSETPNLVGWITDGWSCLFPANAGTISSSRHAPDSKLAKGAARLLFIKSPWELSNNAKHANRNRRSNAEPLSFIVERLSTRMWLSWWSAYHGRFSRNTSREICWHAGKVGPSLSFRRRDLRFGGGPRTADPSLRSDDINSCGSGVYLPINPLSTPTPVQKSHPALALCVPQLPEVMSVNSEVLV
jgi:hypothetical protein